MLQNHLLVLMKGFREYFPDQNREVIENCIHILKEELDFDAAAINQLHVAIYLFHNAVSIKYLNTMQFQIWMFASGECGLEIAQHQAPLDVCPRQFGQKCSSGCHYCSLSW